MRKLKLLFIVGSLRKDSYNKKLAHVAASKLETDHEVSFLPMEEFIMPLMNQDIEKQYTKEIDNLNAKINAVDGVVVTSPEYNGSIASPLKNFIDWTSRTKTPAWNLKPVLLLAASPGALGGVRGLAVTRFTLETLGAHVYPEMFGLQKAHEAFDADNKMIDAKTKERVDGLTAKFLTFVAQMANNK